MEILPKKALERFEAKDGADFAYTLPDRGASRQRHAASERHGRRVPRHPSKALTLDELRCRRRCGRCAAPITD